MGKRQGLVFRDDRVKGDAFLPHHFLQVRQIVLLGLAEFYVHVDDGLRLCFPTQCLDFPGVPEDVVMDGRIEPSLEMSVRERFHGFLLLIDDALEVPCAGDEGVSHNIELDFVEEIENLRGIAGDPHEDHIRIPVAFARLEATLDLFQGLVQLSLVYLHGQLDQSERAPCW